MKAKPISLLQQQTYDWIVAYFQQHGLAPTIREMQTGLKLSSPCMVQSRLGCLQRAGLIDWHPGKARSLKLLKFKLVLVPVEDIEEAA